MVLLDPDVAEIFPDAEAVNQVLEYAERKPDLLRWNISERTGARRGRKSAPGTARNAEGEAGKRAKHQRRARTGTE